MNEIYMSLDGVSCQTLGLHCKSHRPVLPPLAGSLVNISGVHGSFDYGNNTYEDRIIDVDFFIGGNNFKEFRLDVRSVAAWLKRKGRIVFSDEPDKYYIGRTYVSPMLEQNIVASGRFTVSFLCEPFAYSKAETESGNGKLPVEIPLKYTGTFNTCCQIIIRNTGTTPITNIKLQHNMKND